MIEGKKPHDNHRKKHGFANNWFPWIIHAIKKRIGQPEKNIIVVDVVADK